MMKKIKTRKLVLVLSLLLAAGITTGFLTLQESRDFRIAKNLDIFLSLFRELNTFYVDEIDPDKVVKTGIDNMLRTLDPYTVYFPESEADEFAILTTGKYGGIGSLVRGGGDFVVISEVYKGFPSDKAGLKAGDLITAVDGVSMKGLASEKVSDKLKGNPGTDIKVTISRNGREIDFLMKREKIAIPSVPYFGMLDQKTGYIRFSSFTQDCIQEVRKALVTLKSDNAQQIILDLRSNPGGLLTEAVEIVNLFVGPGNNVVSTKGRVKQYDESFTTTRAAVDEKIPLAVLINRGSASAAEIVAGAIQDLDRGVVVGQRSYGKGLVQVTRNLSYNSQLKVTTAKYYIPSGRCVQALDFSHPNEDGSVGYVPDSLISEFKTRNGRIVKDGGGITPDVVSVPEPLSQITAELYLRYFIFDFATRYYWSHPELKNPSDFIFSDKDYADFAEMLKSRSFSYKTITQSSLNELIENAKREKYYDLHKDLFTQLEKDLSHSLSQDLELFRPEITGLIEEEIIGRYFYEEGAISWGLKKDEQLKKAMDILNNPGEYSTLLKEKSGNLLLTRGKDNAGSSTLKNRASGNEESV